MYILKTEIDNTLKQFGTFYKCFFSEICNKKNRFFVILKMSDPLKVITYGIEL